VAVATTRQIAIAEQALTIRRQVVFGRDRIGILSPRISARLQMAALSSRGLFERMSAKI
jgi:hypothetical protein